MKFEKILVGSMLLAANIVAVTTTPNEVHAATVTKNVAESVSTNQGVTREQAIKEGQSLSSFVFTKADQYIVIQNNQYVIKPTTNCDLTNSEIEKIQDILSVFNKMAAENNTVLIPSNDGLSPFVSFARRSHKRDIVAYGSNGYCWRDRHGNFHYTVTKSIGQATWDTIVNGWGTTDVG